MLINKNRTSSDIPASVTSDVSDTVPADSGAVASKSVPSPPDDCTDVNINIENFNIYIDNKEPVYLVPPETQETPEPDLFEA